MNLKFIIPITGDIFEKSMDITNYLRPFLHPDTVLDFEHLNFGFPSVETELGGMFNGSQVVMNLHNDNHLTKYDGVFIDCFDDPGVYACREMGKLPVMGPYQASISMAMLTAERIGIITTDEAGILNEEKKARSLGLDNRIVSIRSLNLTVSDIRTEKEKVLKDLVELCSRMAAEDRVSTICLGCTAMFYISGMLKGLLHSRGVQVNIIEPILCGTLALESLIRQGHHNFIPGSVDFTALRWTQRELGPF